MKTVWFYYAVFAAGMLGLGSMGLAKGDVPPVVLAAPATTESNITNAIVWVCVMALVIWLLYWLVSQLAIQNRSTGHAIFPSYRWSLHSHSLRFGDNLF
jgi:uncharacterized protein HemY